VRTFSLFITDTRHSLPVLSFVVAQDEASAISRATELLAASAFHTAIELREGDKPIYRKFKDGRAGRDGGGVRSAFTHL
jgi:hypothetical protein